jgi:aspartate/methionine/tyrosine aminotransferase
MKPFLKSQHDFSLNQPRSLNLRGSVAGLTSNPGAEIIRYGRGKPDILFLGQGQGEQSTSDFICQAAAEAMASGRTFYDSALGLDALRQEISVYYQRIYGLDIPVQRIAATSSGTTAMHLALAALINEGEEVLAVTPIWKNLLSVIELALGRIREVALRNHEGRWSLDLDQLFASVTDETRVLLITTPSNPTGWMMSREEIKAVLDFARERDLWIVADEVYGRIVYDGAHAPSFLEYATGDDKLFVVNSFSKAWAMTGWRLGWLVMPNGAEQHIRDLALYNNMGPPTFTQYGGIAALQHGEAFLKDQIDLWRGNRAYMMDRFNANDRIVCDTPESAFYGFFKVKGEMDCLELARGLIDRSGLLLAPGCAFGRMGSGYMRICFAISQARLGEALDRLDKAVNGVQ